MDDNIMNRSMASTMTTSCPVNGTSASFDQDIMSTEVTTDLISFCRVCSDFKSLPRHIFVFQLIFPAVTLAANIVTATAIYQSRQMTSSFRITFLNMSFTDIVGSVMYMYHIIFSWTQLKVNMECLIRYGLFVATQILTLLTVQFLSWDRFLALMMPFKYERFSGLTFARICMSIVWIAAIFFVVVGMVNHDPNALACIYPVLLSAFSHGLYAFGGFFATTIVTILNVAMLISAHVQIRKITRAMPAGETRDREETRMVVKSVVTTACIVVPYVVFNLPMYILMTMFVAWGQEFRSSTNALHLINAFSNLALVNSLINPFVYVWRSKRVRDQIHGWGTPFINRYKVFKKCCTRSRRQANSTTTMNSLGTAQTFENTGGN